MLLCPICERGSIAVSSVSMSAIYFLLYNCPHRLFSVTYCSSMVQNISLFCAILFFDEMQIGSRLHFCTFQSQYFCSTKKLHINMLDKKENNFAEKVLEVDKKSNSGSLMRYLCRQITRVNPKPSLGRSIGSNTTNFTYCDFGTI